MHEMIQAIEATTSTAVQLWMGWMSLLFTLSLLFIRKRTGARFALVASLLGLVCGIIIFKITRDPWLLGISHILFWMPLIWILYRIDISKPGFSWKTPYGIWLALLIPTIVTSLIFDFRDVARVLSG